MSLRGTLPILVLQVLQAGPLHGYGIAREIKARSRGVLDFKEGTLYPTLHAHEAQGLVRSFERAESGRRRRYYRLTSRGSRALEEGRGRWAEFSRAVGAILEGT